MAQLVARWPYVLGVIKNGHFTALQLVVIGDRGSLL